MPKYKKSALIIALFCAFQLFVFKPHPAFPQAKEFARLRTTYQGAPLTVAEDVANGMESSASYYISAGDKIEIYVWQNPDLTRIVRIRGDGKLSYPLVGTIQAAGMTIDQLENEIRTRLSKYVISPEVTITVTEAVGNKVIILGQVNYPGVYSFKGSLNIVEAIAIAGDVTPDGHRESVLVISDNLTAHPTVRKVNALLALRNGMATKDVLLHPNDVVYVPRSTIADFNKFLNEIQPTINTLSNFFTAGSNLSDLAVDARAWFMHRTLKAVDTGG